MERLAGAMSRHPGRIALVAILISALGATGLIRFEVDAGQSLLVGSSSNAGQTYASFSQTFGSDPIVLVFTARNPTAPYIENIGVRPDIQVDYMTRDNLTQNGKPFVDAFVAAMVAQLEKSK